ncbi:hypothetical protein AAF712_015953 [Marasmius tenuissimus]|uniref:Uncharacterized protein n=1 Tax=Marasmius tenuissimus TaxID=585030 RepID=A0ABR2Z801_9AGAR
MDKLNLARAAAILHEIEERCPKGLFINPHLTDMKEVSWPAAVEVRTDGIPPAIRVMLSLEAEEIEVSFKVHGMILDRSGLPPIRRGYSKNTNPRFLNQSVTITGMGLPYFDDALEGILEVEGRFERKVGPESMDKTRLLGGMHDGFRTLTVGNRYFTTKGQGTYIKAEQFGKGVNPYGHLQKVTGDKHVYCEENVVSYQRRALYNNGTEKYVDIEPQEIQVGDLVELQFSILCINPTEDRNRWRTIAVLRVITILSDLVAKEASKARYQGSSEAPKAPVKRKNRNEPGMYALANEQEANIQGSKKMCEGGDQFEVVN